MKQYKFTQDDNFAIYTAAAYRAASAVYHWNMPVLPQDLGDLALIPVYGAFVSFKRQGVLRSCMGSLGEEMKLCQALDKAALLAATNDPRFPPIAPAELPYLEMEVWILWEPVAVEGTGEEMIPNIVIGKHGLIASKGNKRGLLLPSVATEFKMDVPTFLGHTCLKAGLSERAWIDGTVKMEKFEGHVIKGDFPACAKELAEENQLAYGPQPNSRHIAALADFTRKNALAFLKGGTVSTYLPGAFDGNVNGLLVRMKLGNRGQYVESVRISLQNTIPFQASLLELTNAVCRGLSQTLGGQDPPTEFIMGISVFYEPAMQGSANKFQPEGIAPSQRGVLVLRNGYWAFAFDPKATPEILLDRALKHARFEAAEDVAVYSMNVVTTEPTLLSTNVPSGQQLQRVRTPVVAGKFYPQSADECKKALDALYLDFANSPRQDVNAVMIPHAGWLYSARLAAQTLSQVNFPVRVIVFCPKHTAAGVDAAVAPQEKWVLPQGAINMDQEFAINLVKACDVLQLDSEAHRNEHSIEAVLPLILHEAPGAKYVAVALDGNMSKDKIDKLSTQMADFFSKMKEVPLLVISSDMNHYANVETTNAQDQKAMDQLNACDGTALIDTVRAENVSMCGAVPAAVVLQTLKKMGKLEEAVCVGHTNSSVMTADTEKVVGYCGYLFK